MLRRSSTIPTRFFIITRRLIALRGETPALVHGAHSDINPAHEQIFAYTRTRLMSVT
jgi:hypothetical protein